MPLVALTFHQWPHPRVVGAWLRGLRVFVFVVAGHQRPSDQKDANVGKEGKRDMPKHSPDEEVPESGNRRMPGVLWAPFQEEEGAEQQYSCKGSRGGGAYSAVFTQGRQQADARIIKAQ